MSSPERVFGLLVVVSILALPVQAAKVKVEEATFEFAGKQRTYFLYAPRSAEPDLPAPLVLLLHGSDRNGMSLLAKWKKLANKERIVLAAPNSLDPHEWHPNHDSYGFLRAVVDDAEGRAAVDRTRIYVFGHSAGAAYALQLVLFDSRFYAAVAIHAGALHPQAHSWIEKAVRPTPISIQVGTRDRFFPLATVRATRDALEAAGFTVELKEISGHDHWYYDRAAELNRHAWQFLQGYRLENPDR
ncbi:MAG: hypothetical protein GY719_30430 [bacterium]|nr:hypothetical protein [bacterium]